MAKPIDWEDHIGRRLKLRGLRVFFAVVECGSMAKAAALFRMTQPAVSQVMVDLEHALGVKLLDRSSRGVEPTIYGRVLLARARAAFDELKQGMREIEFLSDPTSGELRIGCAEPFAASILPPIVRRFAQAFRGSPFASTKRHHWKSSHNSMSGRTICSWACGSSRSLTRRARPKQASRFCSRTISSLSPG